MARSESVIFNGITFRRYPDSANWAERMYFTPGGSHRERGVGRLHQEVWKGANGPIPEGYHVHHKDENPLNNDPSNLECLPGEDHHARHLTTRVYQTPRRLAHLDEIRPLAAEWHRGEQGRAWHREHGRRTWDGREPATYACEQCGAAFESRASQGHSRFCSAYCRHRARLASGVDDEMRACESCGAAFQVNKYLRKRFCTRSCASRFSRRQRAA
jgi:HNH endonuclease